ncbi:hypothetical protein GC207_09135 [bacterium]|nr:hypothetical protein [bacterium]
MNGFIEQLNQWGLTAIPFAAQLLWQTSVLIVVLLALDLVLRNRVRAGFRYTLWTLLLVKLVLPPTIAFPTGVGYWVNRSTKETPVQQTVVLQPKFEVAYPTVVTTEASAFQSVQNFEPLPATEPAPPPPTPKLSRDGWLLVASVSGTLLLLSWMLWRWRWVNRIVKASTSAADELQQLAVDCIQSMRSSGASVLPAACRQKDRRDASPTLRLTDAPMSPAVYGLFRPVILLPRQLVSRLSIEQLRTVLLHELIHLRRRDLWVNCLQSILQIACWWHPLLWLANARIRRVREEAVDEAVASALRDDADAYPATLLEVAKFTITRPLMTLGLVGILESKNALKQRIRRLLEQKPLDSTRLKWWQWTALIGFALAALPMAQGQRDFSSQKSKTSTAEELPKPNSNSPITENDSTPTNVSVEVRIIEIAETNLHNLGLDRPDWILPTGLNTPEAVSFKDGLAILTDPQFRIVIKALEQRQGVNQWFVPRVTTASGKPAQFRLTNSPTSGPRQQNSLLQDFSPLIDVIPYVAADGAMIQTTVAATVGPFADATGSANSLSRPGGGDLADPAHKSYFQDWSNRGTEINADAPKPSPFHIRRITTTANVWNGQTIVLAGSPGHSRAGDSTNTTQTLVFVTPSIVGKQLDWSRANTRPPQPTGKKDQGTDSNPTEPPTNEKRDSTNPNTQTTDLSNLVSAAAVDLQAQKDTLRSLCDKLGYVKLWTFDTATISSPFVEHQLKLLEPQKPELQACIDQLREARNRQNTVEMRLAQTKINAELNKNRGPYDQREAAGAISNQLSSVALELEHARSEYERLKNELGSDPSLNPEQTLSKSEFLRLLPVVQAGIKVNQCSNVLESLRIAAAKQSAQFEGGVPSNLPGSDISRFSPPYSLNDTNLDVMGLHMIRDQSSWPDSRFKGYHPIGLEPRFVLVPIEGLKKALNGQLPVAQPLIVASNQLDALTNSLIEAGAMDHSSAEPMRFGKMSGGVFHWNVASNAVARVQFQTTKAASSNHEVAFGARQDMPAYTPDWVPLTLLARPFAAEDDSLRCLLSFQTGAYDPPSLARTEADIPLGAALVWASTNEVRPGFAQVVILKNIGSPPPEEQPRGEENDLHRPLANVEQAWPQPIDQQPSAQPNTGDTPGRHKIMEKLRKITIEKLVYEGRPLSEVVNDLNDEARRRDPAGEGINFMLASSIQNTIDPATGQPIATSWTGVSQPDIEGTTIDINPPMYNIKLIDALNAIVLAADRKIEFNVDDFAVIIRSRMPETEHLETRTFRVNPITFYKRLMDVIANMNGTTNNPDANASGTDLRSSTDRLAAFNQAIRAYFDAAGVEIAAPKRVYFNDRTGILLVRATPADLEIIQRAVEMLNYEPPQITIEAQVFFLTADDVQAAGLHWILNADSESESAATNGVTPVFTEPQAKVVLDALKQRSDVERHFLPRVTTLSGSQTQLKAVSLKTVVTGKANGPAGPTHLSKDLELGDVLDLKPEVGPDGYTVTLDLNFHHNEFLGYDDPASTGQPEGTPISNVIDRSVTTKANVWDGQTLAIGGMIVERPMIYKSKVPVLGSIPLLGRAFRSERHETETRHLLVLITPRIIDPAGNTVHKPEDMPFAKDAVPKQPDEK